MNGLRERRAFCHPTAGHAINALDPLLFGVDADEPTDQLSDVLDLIGLICGKLDEVERAQVAAITRSVISKSTQTPVLGDIWRQLQLTQPGSRASTILHRWVTGELGQLFSAPTNVDLGAPIIGFNLRDLSEELIPPFLPTAGELAVDGTPARPPTAAPPHRRGRPPARA